MTAPAQLKLFDVAPAVDAARPWFLVCRQRGEAALCLGSGSRADAEQAAKRALAGSTGFYRGALVVDTTRWSYRWAVARRPAGTRVLGGTGLHLFKRLGHSMEHVRTYAARPGRAYVLDYFPAWWR